MKAFVLSMLLLFCLGGCFSQDAPSQTTPPPVQTEAPKTPEPSHRPTDEQVTSAFHQATEAMGWFEMTTMPLFDENGIETEYAPSEGEPVSVTYYPVNHPTIGTTQELWDYLGTLFSPEIVSHLQTESEDRYRDIDGVLYAFAADRGSYSSRG